MPWRLCDEVGSDVVEEKCMKDVKELFFYVIYYIFILHNYML
jgi:hypothetical protein